MRYLLLTLLLLLSCARVPEASYSCWDGTYAQSADLCPAKPDNTPQAATSDVVEHQIKPPVEEVVLCTEDAKVCPDGSTVGRVGSDCSFAPCPELKDVTFERVIPGDQLFVSVPGSMRTTLLGECHVCSLSMRYTLTPGKRGAFGIVMKYGDNQKNPNMVFDLNAGTLTLYNTSYGEDKIVLPKEIPLKGVLSMSISDNKLKLEINDIKLIEQGAVGPYSSGREFGFYVRDSTLDADRLVITKWD